MNRFNEIIKLCKQNKVENISKEELVKVIIELDELASDLCKE